MIGKARNSSEHLQPQWGNQRHMLKDTYYILLRMHRVDKKKAINAESLKIINNFKEGYGA